MYKKSTEFIVGIFVICAALALGFLVFKTSGLTRDAITHTNDYLVTAKFSNIGGLGQNAAVRIAGVQIGFVKDISLDQTTFRAKVTMNIYERFDNIPNDSSVGIQTEGILGESYINVDPGGSEENLKNNSVIHTAYSATSLNSLLSTFASGGENEK